MIPPALPPTDPSTTLFAKGQADPYVTYAHDTTEAQRRLRIFFVLLLGFFSVLAFSRVL